MPRYFFHVYHDTIHHDNEGAELADRNAAWEMATREAGEAIKDIDGKLRPGHDWRMEITDEFANPLWEIHINVEKK